MTTTELPSRANAVIANTYARYPISFVKGEGATLWDTEGKAYTDFVSGIAVCNLGHCHPAVTRAVSGQAADLVHVSNLFYTEPQVRLAEWLVSRSFGDKVFFCNSGAEANEAAIKLARKHAKEVRGTKRYRIVTMEKSFHGRTMATLSATGQEKIRKGFSPVLEGFDHVPYGDLAALRKAVTEETCAVMLEPIQGEGGVRVPDAEYLRGVRRLCDETGLLLIFDEVQTGIARTGRLFAYEHSGVVPDILSLAKALGNGLPIGAILAKDSVMQAFGPGSHATTFGGTPLVTAASLAVLETIEAEGLVLRAEEMGRYFMERLGTLRRHPVVREVRGAGLLIGMELSVDGGPIVNACLEKGFIINCAQGNVLRFVPPLVITKQEIDLLIPLLDTLLEDAV